MLEVAVIADDLTGANATGVLLVKEGLSTFSLLQLSSENLASLAPRASALILSTDSRPLPAKEAYRRVYEAAELLSPWKPNLLAKRIDTTLRGNLGAEVDAALDAFPHLALAVVVPAYPASGRITAGSYLLVHGVPLQETDVARDPRTPVRDSVVPRLVAGQTRRRVYHLPLETVLQGPGPIAQALVVAREEGYGVITCDATTEAHIQSVAAGVASLPFPVLAVDPGPFTVALAHAHRAAFTPASPPAPTATEAKPPLEESAVLVIAGSVTPLTHRQLQFLQSNLPCRLIPVDPQALLVESLSPGEVQRAAEAVVAALSEHRARAIVLKTTGEGGEPLNLKELERSLGLAEGQGPRRICQGLGEIVQRVLPQVKEHLAGLYLTGGDVTVAVCTALGAYALSLQDQVLPLASYGLLTGGPFAGTRVVTKGGLVGGDDAALQCALYLLDSTKAGQK